LHGDQKWDEAIAAYEQGIKVEDLPALQKGLQEVKAARGTSRFTYVPPLKLWMAKVFGRRLRGCGSVRYGEDVPGPVPVCKARCEPEDRAFARRSFVHAKGTLGVPTLCFIHGMGLKQMMVLASNDTTESSSSRQRLQRPPHDLRPWCSHGDRHARVLRRRRTTPVRVGGRFHRQCVCIWRPRHCICICVHLNFDYQTPSTRTYETC